MQSYTIAEKLTKKLNTISLKDNEVIVAVPLPVRLSNTPAPVCNAAQTFAMLNYWTVVKAEPLNAKETLSHGCIDVKYFNIVAEHLAKVLKVDASTLSVSAQSFNDAPHVFAGASLLMQLLTASLAILSCHKHTVTLKDLQNVLVESWNAVLKDHNSSCKEEDKLQEWVHNPHWVRLYTEAALKGSEQSLLHLRSNRLMRSNSAPVNVLIPTLPSSSSPSSGQHANISFSLSKELSNEELTSAENAHNYGSSLFFILRNSLVRAVSSKEEEKKNPASEAAIKAGIHPLEVEDINNPGAFSSKHFHRSCGLEGPKAALEKIIEEDSKLKEGEQPLLYLARECAHDADLPLNVGGQLGKEEPSKIAEEDKLKELWELIPCTYEPFKNNNNNNNTRFVWNVVDGHHLVKVSFTTAATSTNSCPFCLMEKKEEEIKKENELNEGVSEAVSGAILVTKETLALFANASKEEEELNNIISNTFNTEESSDNNHLFADILSLVSSFTSSRCTCLVNSPVIKKVTKQVLIGIDKLSVVSELARKATLRLEQLEAAPHVLVNEKCVDARFAEKEEKKEEEKEKKIEDLYEPTICSFCEHYPSVKGKTILVTGGCGFIGGWVCARLLTSGARVICLDSLNEFYAAGIKMHTLARLEEVAANVLSYAKEEGEGGERKGTNFVYVLGDCKERQAIIDKITNALNEINGNDPSAPKTIPIMVHLAARAGVRQSMLQPSLFRGENVLTTENVLHAAAHFETKVFVFASSSSVYGKVNNGYCSERLPLELPESIYAETKVVNELYCTAMINNYPPLPQGCPKEPTTFISVPDPHSLVPHIEHYKEPKPEDLPHFKERMSVCGLRFFTVGGTTLGSSAIGRIDMAIANFARMLRSRGKEKVTMYGDGSYKRDYVNVKDVVDGICKSIDGGYRSYKEGAPGPLRVFNIGEGHSATVRELIVYLAREQGLLHSYKYIEQCKKDYPNKQPKELTEDEALKVLMSLGWVASVPPPAGDVPATVTEMDTSRKGLDFNPVIPLERNLRMCVVESDESTVCEYSALVRLATGGVEDDKDEVSEGDHIVSSTQKSFDNTLINSLSVALNNRISNGPSPNVCFKNDSLVKTLSSAVVEQLRLISTVPLPSKLSILSELSFRMGLDEDEYQPRLQRPSFLPVLACSFPVPSLEPLPTTFDLPKTKGTGTRIINKALIESVKNNNNNNNDPSVVLLTQASGSALLPWDNKHMFSLGDYLCVLSIVFELLKEIQNPNNVSASQAKLALYNLAVLTIKRMTDVIADSVLLR